MQSADVRRARRRRRASESDQRRLAMRRTAMLMYRMAYAQMRQSANARRMRRLVKGMAAVVTPASVSIVRSD